MASAALARLPDDICPSVSLHEDRGLRRISHMSGYDWRHLGDVRDAVVTIIGDHYGLYGRILPMSTDLVDDLESDFIDKLEVLMTMEELFGVYFTSADRAAVKTVGDVVELTERALERNSSEAPADLQTHGISSDTMEPSEEKT